MSKLSDQIKRMDYRFIVQIHDALTDEWLDYAQFKDEAAAKDFIIYQLVKHIAIYGETTIDIGKIWRVIYDKDNLKLMGKDKCISLLKAKLLCLELDTSGTDECCNSKRCYECPLNYEQGNMGEQKKALRAAIEFLASNN